MRFIYFLLLATNLFSQDNFINYTQPIKGSDVSFKMIAVKGGKLTIGSPNEEKGRDTDEGPQKNVQISDFYIGETEVTYDVYQLFFEEAKDPSPKADGITRSSPPYIDFTLGMGKIGGYPVNSIQQYAALMFCNWLYKKTGVFYRLPTELEWEYVAKKSYPNINSVNFDSLAIQENEWIASNSEDKYHKVASKKANVLGIYDLLGNVSEWTMDQYESNFYDNIVEEQLDPINPKTKRHPITVKGGSYKSSFLDIRPSNRSKTDPLWNRRDPQIPKSKWWNADAPFVGFRLLRPTVQPKEEEILKFFEGI